MDENHDGPRGHTDYNPDLLCSLRSETSPSTLSSNCYDSSRELTVEEEGYLHRSLYRKAFEPVSTNTGMNYPCRQGDLDMLQNWPDYNHNDSVSPETALDDIRRHNKEDKRYVIFEVQLVPHLSPEI